MTFYYAGGGADDTGGVVTLLHVFISLVRRHVLR